MDKLDWDDIEATFAASSFLPVLNPFHPLALTTDLWWGKDKETYICVTGHFFDKDWKLNKILLDIYLCSDRHTGENISAWIKQVLQDNDIHV